MWLCAAVQNMGIDYEEAMETIHVIKRDGQVRSLHVESCHIILQPQRDHSSITMHWVPAQIVQEGSMYCSVCTNVAVRTVSHPAQLMSARAVSCFISPAQIVDCCQEHPEEACLNLFTCMMPAAGGAGHSCAGDPVQHCGPGLGR